jgi:hypothetical protein
MCLEITSVWFETGHYIAAPLNLKKQGAASSALKSEKAGRSKQRPY